MFKDIQYLTTEHIEFIHLQVIELFGGDPSYYDNTIDRIESTLSQQYPHFGYDKYPTIFHKAAMLMYYFSKNHCFVDGNKRVGIQSAIVLLDINGYEDNLDDDEGYEKTVEVAAIKLSDIEKDEYIENLAVWLKERFIQK